jgi:hypothetical protein
MINKSVVIRLEPLFPLVEAAALSGSTPRNDDDVVLRARKLLPDFGEHLLTLTFCLMYFETVLVSSL